MILLSNDVQQSSGPNSQPDAFMPDSSYQEILNNGLSIMHLNMQSLEVETQSYDILVFTETWLSAEVLVMNYIFLTTTSLYAVTGRA